MAALRKNMQALKKLSSICSCYISPTGLKHIQTSASLYTRGDPLPYFLREDVQDVLHRITGFDPERTFYKRKLNRPKNPAYKILSDDELKREFEIKKSLKNQRLQIPPFMDVRNERDEVLSDDPEIAPVLDSKYVFVDISHGSKRIQDGSERPIVCRHEDGKLRIANWEMTDRVLQMFCPIEGREVFMPKMFEEANLEKLLDDQKYLYILERASVQFEPDSSDFIRVSHRIYEHIAVNDRFDSLRYTRFFGHMAFYFAWFNKIELLVADMLNRDLLTDAVDLINLNRILHGESVKEGEIFPILADFCLYESKKQYGWELKIAFDNLQKKLEKQAQNMNG